MRHKLLSMCASLLILAIQDLSPQTARATSITVVSVDEDDRSATVNIFDNSPPPALPMVTIAANAPDASEVGPTNGQFTVTRTGATTSALTVNYAISGTATNTTDYATLSGSVIIAGGSATATITVTPLVDALTEGAETVNLALSANAAYTVGSPRSATVNIFDNSPPPALPMVTIAANSPDASEAGPTNGQFTVTRTGATTSALTVNYAISGTATNGTDYSTLSGRVTIAAGSATATVTVTPLVDALTEGTETVILTLSANAAYNIVGSPKGFKDLGPPDPASTIGGNTGTTLGAQRMIAAQYAADLWADLVSSKMPILVDAKFDAPISEHPDATDPFNSLDCTKIPPVIATAEPTTYHGNFAKAPKKNTWFPKALANSLAGNDLSKSSDIRAYFNSSVGTPACLPDNSWYYGLDGNAQPDQFDFVTVVLRELAHGLGFITTVDLSNGKKLGGFSDVFSLNLEDISTGKLFAKMTNAERVLASKNTGNLRWIGAKVVAAHGGDDVPMYAPDPVDLDFSVSNWDTSLSPDEIMVPFYSGANHDVGLALQALEDIGWTLDPRPNGTVNVVATDATALEGVDTATFTVRRTVPTSDPLTVSYKVSGKATITDYGTLSGIVEIPAGESSATITVTPVFDTLTKEKDETVIVTLQKDPAYTLGFPSTATVTIKNNVVAFGKGTPPPAEIGVPYNFDIPVSGGEEPYKNPVDISKPLPNGLTLSGLTIQGTPSDLAKTASFTIKVTDQQGVSVSKSYKITVLKAVNITTTLLKNGQINKPYSATLKATGGKLNYTWTLDVSTPLPSGLSLSANGVISGTPATDTAGIYNPTVIVTDALGGTAQRPLTLTIN
jgi:hypothetical protein